MINPVFPTPPIFEATTVAAVSLGHTIFDRGAYCKECHHLGRFFAEDLSTYLDGGHFVTHPCSCTANDLGARALMRDAGIPITYQTSTFDNWENTGRVPPEIAANQTAVDRIRSIALRVEEARNDGLNVWLYGSSGTGKTWLAVALMREAMLRGFSGRYIDASALMRTAIDAKEELSALHDCGVLLIDSVERLPKTQNDFAETVLIDLIQYRVARRNLTIFTSGDQWSSLPELNGMLKDNTARYAFVGAQFTSGVGSKWQ